MNHEQLETKTDTIINQIEFYIDRMVHHASKALDALSKVPKFLLARTNDSWEFMIDSIYDRLNKDTNIARLIRYGSLPWSVIIPKGYKYFFNNELGKALLFTKGVHMIRAKVGGGKSLSSFVLAEMYLEETGLGSYFTSAVEKPQVTEDGKWLFVRHRVIDLNDYYKDGRKVMNYNTEKHKVMHKDERHLDYNPRLNKTKEYNKKFIPEQQDEILMRHQGFTHIYKYSQYYKLDAQDMQALAYMHDVETIKTIPIKRWLESGRFDYIPVMLKFTTYQIEVEFTGEMKRKKVGSCKIPVPYELLQRYDTYAEANRYAGLPVDYK